MMRILVSMGILVAGIAATAQEIKEFPQYPVPAEYRIKSINGENSLPSKWNNAIFDCFPEVFNQAGWSCNQASSIGYVMTYEINRIRGTKADDWPRLFTPGFVYSFLNEGSYGIGVSYFDSWEIVKAAGTPTYVEYPYYNQPGVWMSGYERYLKAMENRVIENYSMPVGTPEGLAVFKQFLYNRFEEGAENGGVGSFQIASGGMNYTNWNDPETGVPFPVMTTFGDVVGHAMTFIGWNDSARLDINHDNKFRNDWDNNNDGTIDMRDWEIGALLAVNSWGKGFGLNGFAYVPYRLLAYDGHEGGIWNKSVHVVKPIREYSPQLIMRVLMSHESKEKFRVLAGISTDPSASEPEQIMSFPLFNYQGGDIPLEDPEPENPADSLKFEFGLDITPLMIHLDPGKRAKYFLIIEENDPLNAAEGIIYEFSVNQHKKGGLEEILSSDKNVTISNDSWTVLTVTRSIDFDKLDIAQPETVTVNTGENFSLQLEASGGEAPYSWELVKDYSDTHFLKLFSPNAGDTLLKRGVPGQFSKVDLPFLFPFYGKDYDHLFVDRNGAVHFDCEYYQYPYVIDWNLVFKVRKSIIPLGMTLSMTAPGDMVTCALSDTLVSISWDVSYHTTLNLDYDIQFSLNLYPDGRIEFLYGNQERPPGEDVAWTAGISNGDGTFFKTSRVKEMGVIFENYGTRFEPFWYPDELTLSESGMLRGTADQADQIWNILVKVRDKNQQTETAVIPVSTVDWENTEILMQNYPNPFNRTTVISYRNPGWNRVRLDIMDLSGRIIRNLVDEEQMAGDYTVMWNAKDAQNLIVPPGIYLYRMISGDVKRTGKMVIIR